MHHRCQVMVLTWPGPHGPYHKHNLLTAMLPQVAELTDVKEVTAAAVEQLEDTLARIESAADAGLLSAPAPAAAGKRAGASKAGSKAGSGVGSASQAKDSGAGGAAAGTIDSLSREIVRAKLAEAEAIRRLRTAARAEVELRQKLLQRDARIQDLKEICAGNKALAARARSMGTSGAAGGARSRSVSPIRPGAGALLLRGSALLSDAVGGAASGAAEAGGTAGAGPGGRRAVSAQRARPGAKVGGDAGAAAGPGRCRGAAAAGGGAKAGASREDVEVQLAGLEADYEVVSAQLASMRVEAARREGEILRLEGACVCGYYWLRPRVYL